MTKKRVTTIIIEDHPPYKKDTIHPGIVQEIRLQTKRNQLAVIFRHENPEQAGRIFTTALPLPARPDNPTFRFLVACGIKTPAPGDSVDLKELIGRPIGIRFHNINDAGIPQSVVFEKLPSIPDQNKKEPTHEILSSQKTK